MTLEEYLNTVIREEADKLILRYHAYHNNLHHEHKRNKKRISNPPPKIIEIPNYWKTDNKFNPFYVKKKSKSIAKSIAKKILDRTYKPFPPYIKEISKEGGGVRKVSIYQIPDSAVSKIYYSRLLSKNKHRFSSFSYAYRNDRNVHFAIQDIWLDISNDARLFISEFDFSDFFGSITHDYLKAQYKKNGFYISEEEEFIINAFLDGRDVGIPQGTSISLFLANLVCWELDSKFEKNGLKFARYADDTVIWSSDYQKISKSFSIINEFSSLTGIEINAKKSEGISLLTREELPSEFKNTKTFINFLGYAISVDSVSIKNNSVKKIQKQISYLLYRNLIQPLKGTKLKGLIIPANDRDKALVTAIMQIRRYMYGGLSSQQLRNYINGKSKRIQFKGIMSFYPLVNNKKQLQSLDGWLVAIIFRTLKLRLKLLKSWKHDCSFIFPFNVSSAEMATQFKQHKIYGKPLLEIPSFMLIQLALEKGLQNRGIENIMNPESLDYDY